MNTPAHLILGAAVFARPGAFWVTIAALAGALAPDISLYAMAGWHLLVLGTEPVIVFRELYYSDAWQQVFAIDNSFFLWGALLGIAMYLRKRWLIAFAGAGLLHLALDFPLHNDDGRQHFWPVSSWVFESPVSYWDPNHYGNIIGPLEVVLSLVLLAVLWRRFRELWPRIFIFAAGITQLLPAFIWFFVFASE